MAAGTSPIPVEQLLGGTPHARGSRHVPKEHKGCSGRSSGMPGRVGTQHAHLPHQLGTREGFSGRDAFSTREVVFFKPFWTESVGFQKKKKVHKSWKISGIFSGLLRKNYC